PTIQSEAIHSSVSNDVTTHSEVVLTDNPSQGIPEGNQILIERTEGIPAAVGECCEGIAEIDGRVTKGGERERTHNRAICIDVTLVETDARKKTCKRGVAVTQETLPIKPPASFV